MAAVQIRTRDVIDPVTIADLAFAILIGIITIVAALSVALLVKGIMGRRPVDHPAEKQSFAWLPALTLAAFVVYLAILPWLGFLIASVAFFAVLMLLYGCRSPVKIVLWSLVLPIALHVLFTEAFQILLPAGPFGI